MDDEQHVAVDERVGDLVEGDGPTAHASRQRLDRGSGAVGDDDLADAGAGEREGHASTHLARAEHEHAAVVERAEPLGRERDRGRRHRHRVAADRGLGAGALADLDRVAERAREQRAAGALVLGVRHASRTWPRISPSPMIIESRPAATPKRCATAASSWYV